MAPNKEERKDALSFFMNKKYSAPTLDKIIKNSRDHICR